MPGRSFNSGNYRHGFNGMEKNPEIETGNYDFGARMYASRIGRWWSVDPLAAKFSSLSPYAFVGNMPINAIDPDGKDIIVLFYTKGNNEAEDEMFRAAAFTRQHDIRNSSNFDPAKDKIVMLAIEDLVSIERSIDFIVANYSAEYGKTREVSIFSHSGVDGPVGTVETSENPLEDTKEQMNLVGWSKIDFNWKDKGACANFLGCKSGVDSDRFESGSLKSVSFTTLVSGLDNFKDVIVSGQTSYSYPSIYTDFRLNSENGAGNFINSEKNGEVSYQRTYLVGGTPRRRDPFSLYQNVAEPMQLSKNGQKVNVKYQEGVNQNDKNEKTH